LVRSAQTSSEAGARARNPKQVGQRAAGVDDVLDDQHVAPLDRRVEVLEDADNARGIGLCSVRRHGHEVHLDVDVQVTHEVGEEEHRSLEHPHEQQAPALVVPRDLLAQLAHPMFELVALDQDLADAVAHRARV